MDTPVRSAKQPVSAVLAGPYGHPFHPILVTVPIGTWVASLVFDLASEWVRTPGFLVEGSLWLIGLGVVGALAAAVVGFLDLLAIPMGGRAFRVAVVHMGLNVAVTAAYLGNFFCRQASDHAADGVAAGPLVLSVVSLVALVVSGFPGGQLAYRYGVRVADESTQAEDYRPARWPNHGSHD